LVEIEPPEICLISTLRPKGLRIEDSLKELETTIQIEDSGR